MRRIIAAFFSGMLGALAMPALAVDGLSGEVVLGGAYSGRDYDNAKFREYWTDMHSAFAIMPQGSVSWDTRVGDTPLYVDGAVNGRSGLEGISHEGDAGVDVGSWGLFRFSGSYKRIGHSFATDVKSLYSGVGTGTLTFTDPALQPAMTAVSATGYKASTLNRFVDSADLVSLGLRRDIVTMAVDVTAAEPLTVGVAFMGEQRRGVRPYSSSFGMGNAVEIAEPIDYDTFDVSTSIGYVETLSVAGGIPVSAQFTAAHSGFSNNIPSVSFQNPGGTVSMSNTYSGLPAYGSNSLEPSNGADSISMGVSTLLPYHIGLTGHASVARLTQNATLPLMTVNPGLLFTPLGQTTAGMKVINSFFDTALSLSPVDRVHFKLRYSYREHDNQSEEFYAPQLVNYDSAVAGSATAEAVSYIERRAEFEQVFDVTRRTRVTTSFENEHSNFVNGSSPMMDQNSFRLSVDTQALDWASVRVSGVHAVRDSAYPDYTLADSELPWMRKYYAADRNRDEVTVMTAISAGPDLDISVEHTEGLDDYTHSLFGLQKDRRSASTVDVSWAPGSGLSMNTYVTQEQYVTNQRSRQWSPDSGTTPGVGNPYSAAPSPEDAGNWTLESTTIVRTIGMRTDMQVVPDRLSARIEGGATVASGRLDYASPLSTTVPVDANMWLPQGVAASDETKSINGGISLRYQVTKAVWASLAYRYDLWRVRDDLMDGYTQVAVLKSGAYNGMVSMNTLYRNYEVHTVYANIGTTF